MRFLFCFFLLLLGGRQALWAQINLPDSLPTPLKQYINQQVDSIVRHKVDSMTPRQATIMPRRIFKYNIALTGSFNEGNVNRKLLAFRSEFSWAGKVVELDLHPRFSFGEQNGQLAEREPYLDALVNIFHQKKFYTFLATNMEASNLRGITFRWLGGVGVGWHIARTNKVKLSLTNMILHEGTDFIQANDIILWRNSARLKGQYSLFKNRLTFKHWIYFQPSFTNKNYRWNGIFALEFPIYKNLQFRLNYEEAYESVVPEGRRNDDRVLSLGLSLGRK
jgi:hypothetical protein